MNESTSAGAIVVGAGISGLTCAFLLQRAGVDVILLEKSARYGGAIHSERQDGWLIEAGPNSTLETTPLLTQLIQDAGVEASKMYASNESDNRYILRNGRLQALPMSPLKFLSTTLFSFSAKMRLFKEPFIPPSPPEANESVAEFVQRRLGKEFLDYAINPFVAGVYAGDPELLNVRAAFPKLHALEQKYGGLIKGTIKGARERKKRNEESKQSARMFSFTDGMQTLTDALAGQIQRKMTEVEIQSITVADNESVGRLYRVSSTVNNRSFEISAPILIIATPAQAAAELTNSLSPDAAEALNSIPYPPVAEVLTGFRPQQDMHALDGFGFLIPKAENRHILGTIFSSTIFRDRAPEGHALLTTFIGGMRQPEEALRNDDEILSTALTEQHALIGTPVKPVFAHVTSWEHAIPQYVHGHLEKMKLLDDSEANNPGLYFCANYRGGISVGDCVKSAHAVVSEIRKQ